MNTNPSVNRYLVDEEMDHIDHALGRPIYPLRETHRNHFATDATGGMAIDFAFSPYWEETGRLGNMAFFSVTEAGRRALAAHLASLPNPDRPYIVTYLGHETIVPAKSRSKAIYSLFLDISDCFSELTFSQFAREARARLA